MAELQQQARAQRAGREDRRQYIDMLYGYTGDEAEDGEGGAESGGEDDEFFPNLVVFDDAEVLMALLLLLFCMINMRSC